MNKTLITSLLFMCTAFMRIEAAVIMDYNGPTVVRPTTIERSMLINNEDDGDCDIAIKPLEPFLRSSDGEVSIPLEDVYINNNCEDVYMRYNEYSNLFRRAKLGGIPKQITAKVRDFGMVPAGVYNLNMEIQTIDSDTQTVKGTSVFNMQFIVPEQMEINFHGEEARITVNASEAFDTNKRIPTDTAPMIYINSNCDWVLTLDTSRFGDVAGNYYVRTLAASPNVTERLQETVLITPDKEIIIAKGKAPSNNQYVSIEFSVEGKDGKFLPAGDYENHARFRLIADRRKR